ncbi:MAG TPA: hypothetical protein VN947_14195 [Polyangia bacterium]|nr:hypothetical protein [Polyangia bacterium]
MMRFFVVLTVSMMTVGCATTGDVQVRVPAAAAARVPADAAAVKTARAAAAEAQEALDAAKAEWSRAVDAARAAHVAPASTPELAAVAEAQRQLGAATVQWRAGVADMMRWRRAAAEAHVELELAMFLARGGDEIDLGRYERQEAQLERRHAAAARHVVALHAGADAAVRAVAEAKERYAATRREASRADRT